MKLASENNRITTKESLKAKVYQLSISKQKKTNITFFLAHFGKMPNTSHSNISNSTNLTYEQTLNHSLDADTVPVEDYLDDNGGVSCEQSDIMIEEAMNR